MTMAELKVFCNYLGLERGGGKEELIKRMLDFLLNPQVGFVQQMDGRTDRPSSPSLALIQMGR